MKERFKNLIYVCHFLFTALASTFWEIAALVSTALASSALASTALACPIPVIEISVNLLNEL